MAFDDYQDEATLPSIPFQDIVQQGICFKKQLNVDMVVLGKDQGRNAMSKIVGLSVAIAVLNILNGVITQKGLQIPINKKVYQLILAALKEDGVRFNEYEVPYIGCNPIFGCLTAYLIFKRSRIQLVKK